MQEIIGNIIIIIGLVLIAIGIFGIFKNKDFYSRISIASIIDTAGFITIAIGVIVIKGINLFSLKVFLILCLMVLLNPLATHTIARSAHASGYKIRKVSKE